MILNEISACRADTGPHLWTPDQGDGTYRNPIIAADYSDPDVVRVGEDFFLTSSSFNCTPGLPILHSKDLVNWTIVGHAVRNLPHARYARVQHGCGIWAPSIRFHDSRFWIFFPMPDEGIYKVTADDPAGKWSEPQLVQEGKGLIDPCPLWDQDGKAYLVHAYAASRSGIKHQLRVCPMAPDGSRLLGEGRIVFHDPQKHPTLEGPKFLKKDGWYYMLAPAGGVADGWQVALRSRNIYGPYEDKIVLEQGDTAINGPHQGALVDTAEGEWWFVHFQDADIYGRLTHLQPVRWEEGWPIMGRNCRPVTHFRKPKSGATQGIVVPQAGDEFDSERLGLQWQWHANHRDDWASLTARPGWLRLNCVPMLEPGANLWTLPNLLLQKLPAGKCSLSARLDFTGLGRGCRSGLIIIGDDYSYIAVERTDAGCRLIEATCCRAAEGRSEVIEVEAPCSGDTIRLRLDVSGSGQCDFSHSADGEYFSPVGKLFEVKKGHWIGAKIGLFSIASTGSPGNAWADFDYWRFH